MSENSEKKWPTALEDDLKPSEHPHFFMLDTLFGEQSGWLKGQAVVVVAKGQFEEMQQLVKDLFDNVTTLGFENAKLRESIRQAGGVKDGKP